jgi:hypothetical protein
VETAVALAAEAQDVRARGAKLPFAAGKKKRRTLS